MIHKLMPDLLKEIRKYGDLNPTQAGEAMGRERQIVNRIENGQQLPTPEQEKGLFKKVGLSRYVFVEILCKVLTRFLGRPVIIAPRGRPFLATSSLVRTADYFSRHEVKLPAELRAKIREKLALARRVDAASDQLCDQYEKEIRELIEDALGPDALADDEYE